MKFTLVALVFISLSVFANSRDNQIDLNLIKTYQEINGNTVKITKSFKGNSLNTHICKEVIKKSKNGKKKKRVVKKKKYKNGKLVRKVRRVVFFDENGKKSFKGPLKLQEIENNNPNILTIEIDSKNIKNTDIEKFIPFKAKYKIFDPAVNFKDRRGKTLANLYEVAGKKRFDINLADIETGDHDLFVRIVSNKSRHLNRKKKRKPLVKFVHTASIEFTKSIAKTAHIVANIIDSTPSNSRIEFDLSNSYSDTGEIVKYQIKAFKDNELIQDEEVGANDVSHLRYFFTEFGEYKFEFTAFDNNGSSDTFVSDPITPSAIVPDLKYTIVQDPDYPSVFNFDFSETIIPQGMEVSHYTVIVSKDGEDTEAYGIDANNPVKTLNIVSRGDVEIFVVVDTTLGDVNYEVAKELTLDESIPTIQLLDFSYQYSENDNPFIYNYAFQRNFNEEEIDYFEYTLIKDEVEITNNVSYDTSDPNVFKVPVSFSENGEYELTIKLHKKDGSVSYPFKKSESINFDLGQAQADIELSIIDEGLTLEFVFKPESSSPGNYGYFSGFFCSGTNTQTNEQMNFETIDNYKQYAITRGVWNFECFGKTTTELESNKLSFNLESINQAPIAGLELIAHIPGKKSITVHTSSEDRDGSVQVFELNIQAPSGDIETLNITGDLNITLFEVGVHYFSYRVQDNEGLWSEFEHRTYEVINDKPIANINITPIGNTGSKEVQFSFSASDADGSITSAQTTITTPSGSVHEYPWGINEEIDFTFWEIGTHSITYKVQDNDGARSELDSITYETINIKPLANLEIIPSAPGSRDIVMRQSASDSDGNIIRTLTTLTLPDGEYQEFEQGLGDFDFSLWQDGIHIIGFSVQDNDGDWSEISTVSYEVVSQYSAPIAEIIINPATGSDRVITVTLGHSDTDGEVVEGGLIHRNSNGHEIYYDYLEGDYPININEIGTHEFRYFVIDNDGNRSEDVFATYTFESNVPYPSYELTATEVSGEYQYTPTYTDPNNLISYPELALFGPDGSWQGFDGSGPRILNLKQLGEWKIVLSFFTHDGMRSDSNIKHINVESIEYRPEANLKIDNIIGSNLYKIDASNSSDDKGVVSYKIDITNPLGELSTYNQPIIDNFQLNIVGDWMFSLVVTDTAGLISSAVVKTITYVPRIAKLSMSFDKESQNLVLDGSNSFDEKGISEYLFEVISPSGASELIRTSTDLTSLKIQENGTWTARLETISPDGDSVNSDFESLEVSLPNELFPVAIFNCSLNETNFLDCNSESSYSKNGAITKYTWFVDDIESSNTSPLSYEISQTGSYHVKLIVENENGFTNSFEDEVLIETLYDQNLSEVKITYQKTTDYFHNLDEDLDLTFSDNSLVDLETLNQLDILVNSEKIETEELIDFTGSLLILKDKLVDGQNEISITGEDSTGRSIDYSSIFLAGNNTLSLSSSDTINSITLVPTNNQSVKYTFTSENIAFLPNDEYQVLVYGEEQFFSEISLIDTNKSIAVNFNSLNISDKSDVEFKNDSDDWNVDVAEVSVGSEIIDNADTKFLSFSATDSGYGHLYKALKVESSIVGYEFKILPVSVGARFELSLINLTTGVSDIKLITSEYANEEILTSLIIKDVNLTDTLYISAKIYPGAEEVSSLNFSNPASHFGISSAYANGSSKNKIEIRNSKVKISDLQFLNINKQSETNDLRPGGFSVGPFKITYLNGSEHKIFPTADGQFGQNLFTVKSTVVNDDTSLKNLGLQMTIRFLNKNDISDNQTTIMRNFDSFFNVPRASEVLFHDVLEIAENELYNKEGYSHVQVRFCPIDKDTSYIFSQSCISATNINDSTNFNILRGLDLVGKKYSKQDKKSGGDFWIDNKYYDELKRTLSRTSLTRYGDFSKINGGFWNDHPGQFGRNGIRQGSHKFGNTFDFIPILVDDTNGLSLRYPVRVSDRITKYFVKRNASSANSLIELLNANNGYFTKRGKLLFFRDRSPSSEDSLTEFNTALKSKCINKINPFEFIKNDDKHSDHFHLELLTKPRAFDDSNIIQNLKPKFFTKYVESNLLSESGSNTRKTTLTKFEMINPDGQIHSLNKDKFILFFKDVNGKVKEIGSAGSHIDIELISSDTNISLVYLGDPLKPNLSGKYEPCHEFDTDYLSDAARQKVSVKPYNLPHLTLKDSDNKDWLSKWTEVAFADYLTVNWVEDYQLFESSRFSNGHAYVKKYASNVTSVRYELEYEKAIVETDYKLELVKKGYINTNSYNVTGTSSSPRLLVEVNLSGGNENIGGISMLVKSSQFSSGLVDIDVPLEFSTSSRFYRTASCGSHEGAGILTTEVWNEAFEFEDTRSAYYKSCDEVLGSD